MALPTVGQAVSLEVAEGSSTGMYKSRVGEMDKHHVFIEIPYELEIHHPEPFKGQMSVLVFYRAADGAQCSFNSTIEGRVVDNIPLLKIKKPNLADIHRMQRREFLRVPMVTPIEILSVSTATKRVSVFNGFTYDISGGGLSFKLSENASFSKNEMVGITFSLPLDGDHYEIRGKARVLRVVESPEQENSVLYSLKFFELDETNRQRIVKYTLKRQLEMHQKGLV